MIVLVSFLGVLSAGEMNDASIIIEKSLSNEAIEESSTQQQHVSRLCKFMLCGDEYLSVNGQDVTGLGCHRYFFVKIDFNMSICCIAACSFLRNPRYSWCCKSQPCDPFWGYGKVKGFIGSICVVDENSYILCGFAVSVTYNGVCPP